MDPRTANGVCMNAPRTIRLIVLLLGLAGAGVFAVFVLRQGIPEVAAATAAAGWGVAMVAVFHTIPLLCDVLAWRAVIPQPYRQSLPRLFLFRWIGDSVSAMLPVAQIGGEIVRVRLAAAHGMPASLAGATVLVGVTVSIATQIVFTLSGLGLLVLVTGHAGYVVPVVAGVVISVIVLGLFYAMQRCGIVRVAGTVVSYMTASDRWRSVLLRGEVLDRDIHSLYIHHASLIACGCWTMATWATGAVEIWISLRALGVPAGYSQAYIMESVVQGIRSVMFLVPAALGVQESGFLGVGLLLGIPSEALLAVAVIRRVRELAFGLPGIVAWQVVEGHGLWRGRKRADDSGAGPGHRCQEPPGAGQGGV